MTLINDKTHPQLQYLAAGNIHSREVAAIFTTRNGGVSGMSPGAEHLKSLNMQYGADGESDNNVSENYEIIASSLGFSPENIAAVHQKHTDKIAVVDETPAKGFSPGKVSVEADALITNVTGVLLSVRTADCVPILMYDPINKATAAVHSGWRGTYLQIAVKALHRMTVLYGTNASDVMVAIGPAIGQCCYEVSHDLYEQFLSEYGTDIAAHFDEKPNQKPHCNLISMNRDFLSKAGVPERNFDISNLCTLCNPDLFYSHRRSGFRRGAMASFIGICQ